MEDTCSFTFCFYDSDFDTTKPRERHSFNVWGSSSTPLKAIMPIIQQTITQFGFECQNITIYQLEKLTDHPNDVLIGELPQCLSFAVIPVKI